MLLFRIRTEALQARLPQPWEVVALPAGHAWAGANVALGFCQVLGIQDAAGNAVAHPMNYYIPLNGPIRNRETGSGANAWYAAYASDPEALLGWKDARRNPVMRALVTMTRRLQRETSSSTQAEHTVAQTETGMLELDIEFEAGPLYPLAWSRDIFFPRDPSFVLRFANQDLRDDVRSVERSVDRVRRLRFSSTIQDLADLFDGTEELRAITASPWSIRQVQRVA